MIKSFRGQLAHGDTQRIKLSTNDGMTGYILRKFDIICPIPGQTTCALVNEISTIEPPTPTGNVDFNNPTLVGVSYYEQRSDGNNTVNHIIFDTMKFNQDIYVTNFDNDGNDIASNYYIELEQVKLDLNEATVATLKDMRGRE